MKLEIFAVHDTAADAFLSPHFFQTTAIAIRAFGQSCADPDSGFHAHPSDYTLFHIGTFDQDTGEIVPCTPHSVAKALDFAPSSSLKAVNDA